MLIEYLEGIEGIQDGIVKLIESLRIAQARKLVFQISRKSGINLWPFLKEWIENNPEEGLATKNLTVLNE